MLLCEEDIKELGMVGSVANSTPQIKLSYLSLPLSFYHEYVSKKKTYLQDVKVQRQAEELPLCRR